MKLVAFGLILICCHAWAIEIDDNFSVEEIYETAKNIDLRGILENLKTTMKNGNPVLDPFAAESLPININENPPGGKIIFNGLLANLKVAGLSSYQINSANAKWKVFTGYANADLNWPSVFASTNYVINGSALGYEVYGDGNMNATVKDFRFQVNANLKLKGSHVQITSVTTTISLGGLKLHATGLFNDDEKSEAVSKTISDTAPKLIKDNQKKLTDVINYFIMKYGNKYLSTVKVIG